MNLGWEIMGHNRTNVQRPNEMPLDQEREVIKGVLDRIQMATGRRSVGWLLSGLQVGPALGPLADTLTLVVASSRP